MTNKNTQNEVALAEGKVGYKKTKLGWIPEEWEIVQFKEIAKFNPKAEELPEKFIYIDLESVKDGTLRKENKISKIEAPSRAQRLLENEDILFQTVRPYQKNNLFFKSNGNYVASSGYAQLRAKKCSGFIYQLIYAEYINNQVMARCTGTSFPAISAKDLSGIYVKLPPLPEQQKIATILNTWDKAIAAQEKLIAQKQDLKKGLMQQLLTGKKRFAGFEGEWEEVKIKDIADTFSGGTPSSKKVEYYNGKIPWLKSGELNKGIIKNTTGYISELGLKKSSAKLVEIDTILVAMYGATAGVCGITKIKGAINQAVLALILNKGFSTYFIYQLLKMKMPHIVHSMVQGGQPSLSGGIINSVKVKIPILGEQEKIGELLLNRDYEIDMIRKKLGNMKTQKQGLMQQLLTGAKRVKI
ncbi:restriction endonuclease subunit S [Subsaximicrobium wynnwilliamsii]|uniref:restriction endonuclease subunit S n=1 Tax=Subsaximicrobium wynnwilliamsii TaxID=291179 RepID=UPI0011BD86A8|nr:restriction endonuclease subunit S [Subsaximicrobium wynnwilliamsii]TXD84944.1 restriction endonuclease subunit S [Subsaximicrobium wynnwilliamsii]